MTVAAPAATTSERPVGFRRRADLVIVEQRVGDERVHAVKDPVALRYHRLREHEFFVLERLDGERSLGDLKREYEARFAPETVDVATLSGFVWDLYDAGLVERTGHGEGERRRKARRKLERADAWERVTNLLAIRFRGFDPEPVLAFLHRWCGRLLAPAMLVGYAALVLLAAGLIGVRWDEVLARLPTVGEFFTPGNLVLLACVVAVTKVLHELGHALVQRRFGGECHEMGLLLLVFTPCLYVDVSDAWMLRERWRRIAVSVAGIAVELVLAAVCVLVWWVTEPGLINAACLNLMIASTVGTVFFNGNPLLRYDGYYVLSDLVGVPNLAMRAEGELGRVASAWCLGRDVAPPEGTLRGRLGLIAYALAARVYRWFVMAAIGWFLYSALKPFGFGSLAVLLMILVVGVMLVRNGVAAVRRVADPLWRRSVRVPRVVVTSLIVLGLLGVVLFVPLPRSVRAPGVVRLGDAEAVYVRVPGTLVRSVEYGTPLDADAEIAVLADAELDLELARLRGERELLETRVANLEALRGVNGVGAGDGDALPALREALANARAAEEKRTRDFRDLVVLAPRAGTLLPPPQRPPATDEVALPGWSGRPFDVENVGADMERGTLLGHVGDPNALEVVAIVDQTDVEFLRAEQRATFVLGQRPGEVVEGRVAEITEAALDDVPPELTAWAELPRRARPDGRPELIGTWFRVRVVIEAAGLDGVRPRARGHATVHVAPQTLAGRLQRWVETLLRFES